MRAYYGSRFSTNQTATPEGFLVCHNVPVARTGWQEYLGEEIGATDMTGKVVKVFRSPEEVFSPAAIASFEGKLLTSEHPSELVTPQNATRYSRGVVTNVRQGSGGDSDMLLADLVVHDQQLIDEIQAGKREVSCGYDCTYAAADDGTYQQQQICGNHVAVVKEGRAGSRVSIKDSQNEKVKGVSSMPKIVNKVSLPGKRPSMTSFLTAIGLKQFATDAEPEEIMDAMNAMADENGVDPEDKKEAAKDEDPIAALSAQVAQLAAAFAAFSEGGAPAPAADPLDAAIAELEKPASDNEEESHTIPAENFDEAGPVSSPEDRPTPALTGDTAYKLAALKAMKPVLAAMKDPAERKLAVDAALASFAVKPANPGAYAGISNGQRKPTGDGAPVAVDPTQLGKDIAKKHNPHYKERV
ncbi:DUF2213 domain-containing protein [Paenibacillus agricola]|uniref:DUF2213 domain-containing protein n=1 Tax=Paenibacillus agricola TaxID=2716264 RepID=A0ABX0JGY1_9BACL|nr:DUF2213 domain-containing protein [Paenibacillus agricola]NHN33534.1 DUF2213 domain-containing protein [Paenibacillus agricola]